MLEYTPTREQYAYTFGGAPPAMKVAPGTALRLWSDDAFGGVLRTVDDLSSAKVDLRFVNPQTGPFYVWVAELYGLHQMDAYQLCSQIAEVPVANVVDANYSVVVKAAKSLLPAADAFGGMHADLRARAASLGSV